MSYGHDDRGPGPDRERKGPPDISNMFSLKVDNIPFSSEDRDLRDMFSRYGRIGDIFTPNSRHGGRAGYAFVRYFSERDAEDALRQTDGVEFMGRRLRCQWARFGRGDGGGPRGGPPGGAGGGYGGPPPGPRGGYDDRRGPPGGYDDRRGPPGGGYDDRRGPPGGYDDRRGPPGGGYDDRRGPPGGYDDRRGPPGGGYDDRRGPPPRRDDRPRREPPAPREPVRIPYVAPTPGNKDATVRISDLPASISRYDVRLFAEKAGPIVQLDLEAQPGRTAWVEFADPATAEAAVGSLHGGEAVAIPVRTDERGEKARVQVTRYDDPVPAPAEQAPPAAGDAGAEGAAQGGASVGMDGGEGEGEGGAAAPAEGDGADAGAAPEGSSAQQDGEEDGADAGAGEAAQEEGDVEAAEDLTS